MPIRDGTLTEDSGGGAGARPGARAAARIVGLVACLLVLPACAPVARTFLPAREPPLVVATADSGWQERRAHARIVAGDACLDQLVRALFDNVGFSEGHIVILSAPDAAADISVDAAQAAHTYRALIPLLGKDPAHTEWKRLHLVSQFDVARAKERVVMTMEYTEAEARAVLARYFRCPETQLPPQAERRLAMLRTAAGY